MVKQFRSMTYPYVAWISVIIVVPMLLIVLYAFTTSGNDVLTIQFTFDNFVRFVTDSVFMEVLLRSLYIAVITTLICILLGYPIAYVIAQLPDRGNTLAILLITMPTWVNMLVRTYAWMGILQDEGVFNTILGFFGIAGPDWLADKTWALFVICLLRVWQFGSAMVLFLAALKGVPADLYEAATIDGASKTRQFFSITVPGHILYSGLSDIATSRNSLSRNGTRPSTPHALSDLLALRQSY